MESAGIQKAKRQASHAREALVRMGFHVRHSQALEVIAAINGYANWHTYRSSLQTPPAVVDQPSHDPVSEDSLAFSAYKLYAVDVYAQVGTSDEYVGHSIVLARTDEEAQLKALQKTWRPQIEADVDKAKFTQAVLATLPLDYCLSISELAQWMRQQEYDQWDLDEWVRELYMKQEIGRVNAQEDEEAQEQVLSDLESESADINNSGLEAQLTYLSKAYRHWTALLGAVRDELNLEGWPFELDKGEF